MTSVFADYRDKAWPHKFNVGLEIKTIAGGVPVGEKAVRSWIDSKLADADDRIRAKIADRVLDEQTTMDEAAAKLAEETGLTTFRRNGQGLYIEGRQVKAMLKEATSVAANAGKITTKGWGSPDHASFKKQIKGWFPEHVFVLEDEIPLGVDEPSGTVERFVHSRFGSSIKYEQYVEDCRIEFTVVSDHDFKEEEWAMIWLTAEQLGVGASRSQGFGRFEVVRWEPA